MIISSFLESLNKCFTKNNYKNFEIIIDSTIKKRMTGFENLQISELLQKSVEQHVVTVPSPKAPALVATHVEEQL